MVSLVYLKRLHWLLRVLELQKPLLNFSFKEGQKLTTFAQYVVLLAHFVPAGRVQQGWLVLYLLCICLYVWLSVTLLHRKLKWHSLLVHLIREYQLVYFCL